MRREYRIHPAIGIARLGNSDLRDAQGRPDKDAYFIGPEAPGAIPLGSGPYRDPQGKIKRQGARFRIYEYAYDETDWTLKDVREITAGVDDAAITWRVRLANKKAASETFGSIGLPDNQRSDRNPGVSPAELIVDSAWQTISGINQTATVGGMFRGSAVTLGDLMTDEAGRLVVLGGHGVSFSVPPNLPMGSFCDNPGWSDDTSDGPVTATLSFGDGPLITVDDSSWVIVAPPDYAPAIENIVTLYDVARDVATLIDPMAAVGPHTSVSFTQDIYPILKRAVQLQWVLSDARTGHSGSHRGNFLHVARFAKLADNGDASAQVRSAVFERLVDPRAPTDPGPSGNRDMPKLNSGLDPKNPNVSARIRASLTPYQYDLMKRWRDGMFLADWPGSEPAPATFEELPDPARPAALDRAALEACVGSPFYPGIEAGYIMARRETYGSKPFRISDQKSAGDITASNAVPWQADFVECGVNWWPAQRPVNVYRAPATLPQLWTGSGLPSDLRAQHQFMVKNWANLGFIVSSGDRFVEQEMV